MNDAKKTSDHLRYAAENLEDAQTHLSGASRNASNEDFEDIIEKADETVGDLIEVFRELGIHAGLWEKSDELDEDE